MSRCVGGVRATGGARAGLIAGLALALSMPLGAQQVDSLPFRAGQWGVEFTAANFSGIGAVRFTSPRQAWLLDVQGAFTRQSGNSDQPTRFEVLTDTETLQLRLGWRRYGTVTPRVVRHVSFGVLGRYESLEQSPGAFAISPPFSLVSRDSYSAGVFAELGAQWMVTPNLGLGATWSANVQAGRADTERFSALAGTDPVRENTSVNTLSGSVGVFAIKASVFF